MIHKSLITAAVVLFLLITACEKIDELATFSIKHETSFTIPGQNSGIGDLLSLPRTEVKTSSQQTFENNNTNAGLVEEVSLNELVLTVTAPEEGNFDFLNSLNIYIKAEGVEEVLIASKTDIPETGSKTIVTETSNINLRPYLVKENYSIRTEVKTDKVLDHNLDVKINMAFKVKAGVLN